MTTWWERFFRGPWEQIQLAGYPEERTKAETDFIVDALEIAPGARVLDVPCGEGRHTIELARRGFHVTGIDFNERAIETGRRRAAEAGVVADLSLGDMRTLRYEDEYDAAICYFGSFGYFSDEENLQFSRGVARALRPGGAFLIDVHVMESLYPRFQERGWSWASQDPPVRVVEERRIDLDSGRIESTWTFLGDGLPESHTLSIRLYGFRELRDLLTEAGFTAFRAYETGSKQPFRVGSSRLTMVAIAGER